MPMHKLAEGPFTMTVASIESVEGNFGPQFEFVSTEGVSVYLSELAAAQQLARLNLTTETVVGKTLHMEQVKKNGKTFTNLSLVGAGQSAPAASPQPARAVAVTAAPKRTVAELAALYDECVNAAFLTFGNRCEAAGVSLTAEALQSATATLFIAASR
jgi:predicted SpoU family rRNA methylase